VVFPKGCRGERNRASAMFSSLKKSLIYPEVKPFTPALRTGLCRHLSEYRFDPYQTRNLTPKIIIYGINHRLHKTHTFMCESFVIWRYKNLDVPRISQNNFIFYTVHKLNVQIWFFLFVVCFLYYSFSIFCVSNGLFLQYMQTENTHTHKHVVLAPRWIKN